MAFNLIEIKNFPKTTILIGGDSELIPVSKANGITYGIKTDDLKQFMGTVVSLAPKPLFPSDPAPSENGIYIPQEEAVYPDAGGLSYLPSTTDKGKIVQFILNNGSWVKYSVGLPVNVLEDWEQKSYPVASQVIFDGQLYTSLAPALGTDIPGDSPKWSEDLFFMRALDSYILWGVGDEFENILMYIDSKGETHLKLSNDSKQLGELSTDFFDIAFSDKEGNVILGVDKFGNLYPDRKDSEGEVIKPSILVNLETLTQPSDISKDGIWNQWIEPIAVVDSDGTVWVCSVGYTGNLYVTKRDKNGLTRRYKIGGVLDTSTGLSDDHNCPAILLDDRPGAPFPIMVFQCDHNTRPLRVWKFPSKDMDLWDGVNPVNVNPTGVAYSQVSRFGDEIFVFSRIPALPRNWRVAYSSDNGENWTIRTIFSTPATWLYMICRVKNDGSGLNIAMYTHPLNGTDHNIYFLELDFASGALVNPANRSSPVILNIRSAIANTSFVPIDPFPVALNIYTAVGSETTRLWDVSREATGEIGVVLNSIPSTDRTMVNFKNSKTKVVTFNLNNGAILKQLTIADAGVPIENPKGSNMYFAGSAMIDKSNCAVMVWRSNSMINDIDNTDDDIGVTECSFVDFSDTLDIQTFIYANSGLKVIRPFVTGGFVVANECSFFNDFNDFYANTLINEIKTLKK